VKLVYPECCGMPQLEAGDLKDVSAARGGAKASPHRRGLRRGGADTASCGLMMKFEWPLDLPDDHEVGRLSAATKDI
jgi:glycerol-3-phosphate dehydrogenase subunit C